MDDDPEQLRARLRQIHILRELPDDALDQLARGVKWIEAKKGDVVAAHLAPIRSVFFLIEGECRVQLTPAAGQPVALRRLKAGAHFGEIALLTGTLRTVQVLAHGASVLAECPPDVFEALMRDHAAFSRAIAASLARTVVALTERVFELASLDARYRVYAELIRLAKTGTRTREGIVVEDMPTHAAIAETIGSQREAVSRDLAALTESGIIKQEGRTLLIRDLKKLKEMVRRRSGPTTSDFFD